MLHARDSGERREIKRDEGVTTVLSPSGGSPHADPSDVAPESSPQA